MTASSLRPLLLAASCVAAAGVAGWPAGTAQTPAEATAEPHGGLPLSTFATADFSGSGVCAVCHSSLRDAAGADVSIDAHWRSTMMAHSARDPLWQAKVSAEVARTPALRAAIEAKCATCHTPMARTQALAAAGGVTLLEQGFLDPAHPLHDAATDGVSCTLCHQVQSAGLGAPGSYSGGYQVDTQTTAPDRLAFGPFAAPFGQPMRNFSGFTPVEAAHVTGSGLCGSCHTLHTPTVDAAGAIVGSFPEQTPYLEWRHSAFGDGTGEVRSCQSCHMPAANGAAVISNRPAGRVLLPRQPVGQHHFVGGNAFMLRVLADRVEELGLTASTSQLARTAELATHQVGSRTAQIAITDVHREGRGLEFGVEVRNLAGHKLPTGFPSRRAWLHVTVRDTQDRVVFESGRPQAGGRITGDDADEHAGAFEPHYDAIHDASQVQIYEAVMRDTDGRVTHTLLRAASYAKDNRLLPAGFLPATAPADVAVRGEAATDRDFDGGIDRVGYAVGTGPHGPLVVEVRLLYQTVAFRFAEDLRRTATPQVERFGRFYDAADRSPVLVASARVSVE